MALEYGVSVCKESRCLEREDMGRWSIVAFLKYLAINATKCLRSGVLPNNLAVADFETRWPKNSFSMSAAALQAVRKFRVQEFKGLEKHILRFGPLPPPKSVNDPTLPRLPNPFVPRKNPKTGRWNDPKYSLRQQAELVKKAKAVGLLHLLPPGPKNPTLVPEAPSQSGSLASQSDELQELWAMRVEWEGSPEYKKVPGADLGARLYAGKKRMFKGHKWERVKAKRKAKRRVLLRDMDRRVSKYKSVSLVHAFCGSLD